MTVVKRCPVCSRFRAYETDDRFCLACGHEGLESACECGRQFEYALHEREGDLFCPRCGRSLRGRSSEFV
jgi:hypothetical protein